MNLIEKLVGKTTKIYYNDTNESVTITEGKLISFDENYISIKDKKVVIIPINKIIRIEPYER